MNEQERIIRLEEKIAYLEQTIEQLDDVVCDLNTQVTALNKQMVDARADTSPVDDQNKPQDEKPPHYGGLNSAV
ncbi:MAG: SlyX family protein [Phycisphaerae bacterium]|nr:SlyX family protein [Phycisphaerae bacterium]